MLDKEIQSIFKPIIGQFVWGAKQGYGSFLNLEFGNPKIELGAKHKPQIKGKFPFNKFEHRQVNIKGDYTLFIYMADWKIFAGKIELSHSESEREDVKFALRFINGQKLISIKINPKTNITEFEFDLGGIITISNESEYDLNEMWNFYTLKNKVLSYQNNGKICFERTNVEYGNSKFKKMENKIVLTEHNVKRE